MQAPNFPSNFPPHKWLDCMDMVEPYFALQMVLLWMGTRIWRRVAESGPFGVVFPHPVAMQKLFAPTSGLAGRQTVPIPLSDCPMDRDSFSNAVNQDGDCSLGTQNFKDKNYLQRVKLLPMSCWKLWKFSCTKIFSMGILTSVFSSTFRSHSPKTAVHKAANFKLKISL